MFLFLLDNACMINNNDYYYIVSNYDHLSIRNN